MLNAKHILLGLTTTGKSNWRDKIAELSALNITEVALLPTMLDMAQRKELYRLLETSPVQSIPYVHLRDDMTQAELDYLVARFKTKIFSTHANEAGYKLLSALPKYAAIIYMENSPSEKLNKYFTRQIFEEHKVAGICLDLAHLENIRRNNKPGYKRLQTLFNHYTIECNHVSAISTNVFLKLFHKKAATHDLKSLSEFDYLRKFPENYFGKYIIIELENSLQEQLEVQKHLVNMLEYVINQ